FKINSDAPLVYSEKFIVRSYHVDINRKLTLQKLCSFFQDIAGNHTVECGVGWEIMQAENVFWVLSRLKIEVTEYPEWRDEITIKTWSNGLDGLLAIRNFQVIDSSGNELVKALSSWLMVNTKTRRLVRPEGYMNDFPLCNDRLFTDNPGKIAALKEPINFDSSPVLYTETDMNQHMNNVSYIDRIINSFSIDFVTKHKLSEFEINFQKEAVPGEILNVQQQEIGNNEFLNSIVQSEKGKEMVRTKMKWNKL
ncbi:MAG: thioesterase, partial [Prolixibacteraceae bacterium]|nr:thioesterase [Prolixibacteraceae bacterium]